MTVTNTETPATVTSDETAPVLAPPRPATGFAALLSTGENTRIGRLWIGTSFLFLLVAGVTGGVLGVEKIDVSGIDVVDEGIVAQLFSLHAVAGVYLFLVPLLLGLGIAVVPRQVGASTVAFPRAAAAAFWSYLVGGGIVIASFIADGGPGGSDLDAVGLFVVAMIMVLAGLCLGAVSVATTGLALRTEGMSVRRTPLFTWANVLAAALWILTLPVLGAILMLVYVDVRYGPTLIGSGDQLYLRMAWAWSQPSNLIYAIPVLGLIGDVTAPAARTRFVQHRVAMGLLGAFAVFSFGAWAMPGFSPDTSGGLALPYADDVPFIAFAALSLVALLGFAGLVGATVRRGALAVISPFVWAVAALAMLLAGAANGVLVGIGPFDLTGTTATTAQIHYVLVAALLGAFGGLVYWTPVIWPGKRIPEGPSMGLAGLGLLGTVLLCLPDLVAGFLDQSARLGVTDGDTGGIEFLNIVSLVGGLALVLVALGFLGLYARTAMAAADEDGAIGWEGHTLEWADGELPPVHSESPVYDARHAEEVAS